MPNPSIIPCPEGEWTLIDLDQIMGYIFRENKKPSAYLYTYRMTGEAKPTDRSEGVPIFTFGQEHKFIIALAAIDIYVMAIGDDGAVRYDWTY